MAIETLWRHRDFSRLWAAQSISQLGSQVTTLALPLAAALTLRASPAQMGVLAAVQYAPFLLFGLLAGVWVDRLPRRPILIGADVGRAFLLATIPIGALIGGFLAEQIGLRQTLLVGALGGLTSFFWLLFSPLRSLRAPPSHQHP